MRATNIQRHLITVRAALRTLRDPVARGRMRALERRLMLRLIDLVGGP